MAQQSIDETIDKFVEGYKEVIIKRIRLEYASGFGDGDASYNEALDTAIEIIKKC
jgi:hypothetical protein